MKPEASNKVPPLPVAADVEENSSPRSIKKHLILGEVPSARAKLHSPMDQKDYDGGQTAPLHGDMLNKMRQGNNTRELADTALLGGSTTQGNYTFREASDQQIELHTAFSFRGEVRNDAADKSPSKSPNRIQLDVTN